MINEAIMAELFAALDTVVMERVDDDSFRIIGTIPDWFIQFYPDATSEQLDKITPEKRFPFLENFLIDAEDFWVGNGLKLLKSGLWSEIDLTGKECYLEASAVRLKTRKMLLISLVEIAYKEKELIIQKGRENNLNRYQLTKEIDKKEFLFHCILHDLAGELGAINYCFQLLGLQELTPKGREYVEVGIKQTVKQEMVIREILDAFSAEAGALDALSVAPAQAPDALTCAREVVEALLPTFKSNKISLQLAANIDFGGDWKVVGEKLRLERALTNLVENASRFSPPASTVTVGLEDNGDFILLAVDDEGSGVPQEVSKTLFQKFSQGKNKFGRAGLGLYFCRITVESWGGTIGYSPRQQGGSRFWFRLPRPIVR